MGTDVGEQPCIHHGTKPATIAVRGHGNPGAGLHIYAPLMITGRFHLLHEKFHILLRIAKETVLLKKCLRVIMVNVACHDIKRNISASFIRYVHQITDKLLKQKQLPVDSDIECSLRSVQSETCSLSPRQKNRSDFSFPDRLDSEFVELVPAALNLICLNRLKRCKYAPLVHGLLALNLL